MDNNSSYSTDSDDYRLMFENPFAGLVIVQMIFDEEDNPVDYIILESNSAFEKHTGLKKEQVLGKRVTSYTECEPCWFEKYGNLVKTGIPERFTMYNAALGRWFDVQCYSLFRDNKFAVVFTDATKEKVFEFDSERITKIAKERLTWRDAVMDALPVGVWISDEKGRIIKANKAARKIFGKAPLVDKIENYPVYKLFYPDTCDPLPASEYALSKVLRGERVKERQLDIERFDGTRGTIVSSASPVMDESGKIIGAVCVTNDVTNQMQAEKALRLREEKLLALLTSGSDIIFRADPNWRTISLLQSGSIITGKDTENLSWLNDYIPPEDHQKIIAAFENAKKTKCIFGLEHRAFLKGGSVGWLYSRAVPVRNRSGKVTEWFGAVMNISARKTAEENLIKSEQKANDQVKELEGADRNKNQFLSVLSHELRNPLASVVAGLSLLEITDNSEVRKKTGEIINRQIKQVCKLVDDLLDLTRISNNKINLNKENVLLEALLVHSVENLKPDFEIKGVQLIPEICDDNLIISADPFRITQCVENILHNALKFTEKSGTVRIILRRENSKAVISVLDNGIGISKEMLPQLFEPFVQADVSAEGQKSGGLGLGLSIVKAIMEMHEGKVSAYSEGLGKGTEVKLSLPLNRTNHKLVAAAAVKSNRAF